MEVQIKFGQLPILATTTESPKAQLELIATGTISEIEQYANLIASYTQSIITQEVRV
jgi:hypothetical protein